MSVDPRVAEASRLAGQVLDEVEKAVVGKRDALQLVLAAVLAKGHVLLEDFPGLGKTLAARSLATALGLDFARAQFTPDLLPADLTGSFLYDQRAGTFEFRRGPLFTGLLLADEINRTPPKTQSALLEAMQERQVTVEGETFPLAAPFHVLATANPIEYEGTYPLPEAQLDRFLLRVSFGYPRRDEEYDVLVRRLVRQQEEVDLTPVTDSAGVLAMQAATETVTVDESVGRYCVDLAIATRDHPDVLTGSSPRGSLGLVLAARGWAVIRGRDYVIPEDVKAVARSVLAHRVTVKPELWMTQASGRRVVDGVLGSVATPSTLEEFSARRSTVNRWEVTPALSRALLVGALLVGGAVLLGEPALVVLAAPLVVVAAYGLVNRPASAPVVRGVLDHVSLYEGQGTRSRLQVTETDGVEHVTRISAQAPYVALHPASGRVSGLLRDGVPVLEVSPRRWGRRTLGEEKVALTSPWAGYRWGPVLEHGAEMMVLPASAPFDSAAEAPQPLGLVGANRSRRLGDGTEFGGIRPFHAGDRLRRINWRVSLRTGELHVVTSPGEEDSGVLLVVDGLSDFGRSGGVDGGASSLDVTMRAASALAEHFVRNGDRVALRVIGAAWEAVGYGSGRRHLRQILGRLAAVRPARLRDDATERLRFGATAGTVVIVLSPLLSDAVATATASLHRRGLPVLAIDTLPDDATALTPDGTDPLVADLAWRLRRTERDHLLTALARQGCPVVAWHGPGTLDDVLHRLARRAQLPQVRAR